MAKIHLDRMIQRYGYTNEKYAELIQKILANNNENITRRFGEMRKSSWGKALKKISLKEKPFIIPDVSEVLPARSIFILKAAQNGKLMQDTLRDSLTKNLRDTLNQFTPKTQEATFIRRRGIMAGTINPKLINQYEEKIAKTFKNYVRKDKTLGMPSNLHTIALTEIRTSVNNMQQQYINKLLDKNVNLEIIKTWIQNKSLSMEYRESHNRVNGKSVKANDKFEIPLYIKIKGKWTPTGKTIFADHPHAPELPASETIGCSCDMVFRAKRI